VILLIFLVWGFSSISFAYLFSFFVPNAAGGFALKTVLHIFTGAFGGAEAQYKLQRI
jgi:hypothetical protein